MSSIVNGLLNLIPRNSKVSKATIIGLIIALAGGIAGVSTGIASIAGVFQGALGINGINGINGTAGTNGVPGANGINGTNGSNGSNGTNGTNGSNGSNGINGTNGTNGSNGINYAINDYTYGYFNNVSFTSFNITFASQRAQLNYVAGNSMLWDASSFRINTSLSDVYSVTVRMVIKNLGPYDYVALTLVDTASFVVATSYSFSVMWTDTIFGGSETPFYWSSPGDSSTSNMQITFLSIAVLNEGTDSV